jgi:pimeloyl-ACP methyl ester carboxylesterase
MKIAYFISGLGADERMFSKLNLPNIEQIHVEWENASSDDTLASYAKRLLPQIDTEEPVILIGLSFGGMLAVELSKLIVDCQTIIISSAATPTTIPSKYKWLKKPFDKIPFSVFRQATSFTYYLFGVKKKVNQSLLKEVLAHTDEAFFRWAIGAVLSWDNNLFPSNFTHIHGTHDRILPFLDSSDDVISIEGAGHLMVLDKSILLSSVLQRIINK